MQAKNNSASLRCNFTIQGTSFHYQKSYWLGNSTNISTNIETAMLPKLYIPVLEATHIDTQHHIANGGPVVIASASVFLIVKI